jgi:hypothetical protein
MAYSDISLLPPAIRSQVETELESGERAVWMDQPIPRKMARKTLPGVLFGIPWTAFAIFWVVMASHGVAKGGNNGPGIFFPLFGLPFVLIGFGMLSSPYWTARKARRSVYVVTDRRAILILAKTLGGFTVQSFRPQQLNELQRNQNSDGSGDLIFQTLVSRSSKGREHITHVGFLAVRDVKFVEDLVRALAEQTQNRPAPEHDSTKPESLN